MGTARPTRGPGGRARFLAACGLAAVAAASLAACGSSSNGAAKSSSGASGDTATSALAAQVAALTKPLKAYPVPTTPISNVKSLSGKTIYYIPITQQAPQFTITAQALTAAADKVGMTVQICNGNGTPTTISACVNQATAAKAAGIIADAIPYVLAANAFGAAQAAHIPVIIGNQIPTPGHPASKYLAYVGSAAGSAMEEALAKWIILNSGGNANVLINMDTDGPSPVVFESAGQKVFTADCASCKITVNKVSTANFSLVASSTSSALLKNPNVNYVESEYEQFLQFTQTGIQQTSRTGITVVDGAAQLASLQAVKNGSIDAAAGQASAYQGWVYLDALMRMDLGDTLPAYTIPVRLFTKGTIGSVSVTAQAQDSGAWFGPTNYPSLFEKLWGVS